jgi:FMN phosphatase YigB (HAD superfamily)
VECSGSYRSAYQYEKSMIRNIIFDLGNVLISFNPDDYLDKIGYASAVKNIIISDIFKSREWELLDNGSITVAEAIKKISARSSLKQEEIASIFNLRTKIMYPINRNIKLLPGLKKRGFNLYFLSNFPEDIFDEVFQGYEFFKLFDGGIISSKVKYSKPDIKIFEILINKYSLDEKECLFIDDIELNARAANSLGIKSIIALKSADLHELIEIELNQVS